MDTKAAFEKHLRDQGIKPVGWLKAEYWDIWQASRAEVEIELPDGEIQLTTAYGQKVMMPAHEVVKAITSHRIRIKGKTE